jgi:hypothetical protein
VSIAEVYCREISRNLRYVATWPAGAPIAVGRVGRFFGERIFDAETSLGSFGIAFAVEKPAGGQEVLSHVYQGEVGVSVGAQVPDLYGGTLTAGAKTTLSFTREHGIVFRASGLKYRTMLDQPQMAREVATLISQGQWNRDWYIVTQTVEADEASILISNAAGASVDLSVSADAQAFGIELLSAEFKPRVIRRSDMNTMMLNEGPLVPLFRVKRVKRTIFGNTKLQAGFGPTDVTSLMDQDDDELDQNLFEDEVETVDQIVVAEA